MNTKQTSLLYGLFFTFCGAGLTVVGFILLLTGGMADMAGLSIITGFVVMLLDGKLSKGSRAKAKSNKI